MTPQEWSLPGVDHAFYGGETKVAACFPLVEARASECRKGVGKLFGRLFGLRVNLESFPLRVMEGEFLYRIVVENATGTELREVRIMETWTTGGPKPLSGHRTLLLPPLRPRTRHLVERRASFPTGLLSLVVAVSASSCAAGVLLASDRRRRLVVRHGPEARHG